MNDPAIRIPPGCTEIGDCMVVPPGGTRTIPAKAFEDETTTRAIDREGNAYVITYEDDDETPIFSHIATDDPEIVAEFSAFSV